MNAGPDDLRVEEVLTEWFLAEDEGRAVDLTALCGGDATLEARVRALLGGQPRALEHLSSSSTDTPAPRPAAIPERLGEFRLRRLLGSGGSASVFVAFQESLGREVALKVLDRSIVRDERARLRFRREAELVAALDHPHVVPVYAVGEADGFAYLAMKLLGGPSLAEVDLPLAPREVARIGRAVAEALEVAHLSGVIHRDVKPGNILLDRGQPVVVDFGLARSRTDLTLTRPGAVPGTLPYMAPELLRPGPARLDPRVDVYSLGATMYELLVGRPPHDEDEPELLLQRILTTEVPALGLVGADRDLETIVLRALEKDPRRRIENARLLADELDLYLRGQTITTRRTGRLRRGLERVQRNRPLFASLGAAVGLALLAGSQTLWTTLRDRRSLAEGVRTTRAALRERDYAGAETLLEPLLAAHGDARDLQVLAREARAGRTREELLTAVLNRPIAIHPQELAATMTAAEAALDDADEPDVVRAALAVGAWHLGDSARATHWASTMGGAPNAVRRALDALLSGGELPVLEDDEALGADQHVLVALVLGLRSAPLAEQEARLDRALRQDPSNAHARYALAVALSGAGRHRRAREILWGLTHGERTSREVWRNLARSEIATGDLDEARETLDRIPREAWSPVEAYLELELFSRRGDWSAFEASLAEFHARIGRGPWAAADEVLRAEAEYRGHIQGDVEAADALFDRVQREARDVVNRDLAAASQYMLAVQRRARDLPADLEVRRALCRPLVERGAALAQRLELPRARGLVRWQSGLLELFLARNGEGFRLLEEAISLLPDHAGPRLDYVTQVLGFLRYSAAEAGPRRAASDVERYLELCAWREANALLESLASGDVRLPDPTHRAFLEAALGLAERMRDWSSLAELVRAREALGVEKERRAELQALVEGARLGLESVYGRPRDAAGD